MKITTKNYFRVIEGLDFETLPLPLKQSHTVILVKTVKGEDWSKYKNDADFKRMANLAFIKLEEFIASKESGLSGVREEAREFTNAIALRIAMDALALAVQKGNNYRQLLKLNEPFKLEKHAGKIANGYVTINTISNHKTHYKFPMKEVYTLVEKFYEVPPRQQKQNRNVKTKLKPYSKFGKEYYFIQRFLDFHNTTKSTQYLLDFLAELELSMETMEMRKSSIAANEILYIQSALKSKTRGLRNSKISLRLRDSTIQQMEDALQLIAEQNIGKDNIQSSKNKNTDNLQGIEQPKDDATLAAEPDKIINSADFANTEFKTIGFTDKWLAFMGDPCPGFRASVSGMPKMGKTFLCIDFASYLSKNFGKVLYVSAEEYLSPTFALKLKDKKAYNSNLDISGTIPESLADYQFIFLDSVTSLKLTVDDLKALEAKNPCKSFIYVFQVTKAGKARGTNEFMHNVDIIIEVPERGKAVQYGRYNQGGELKIFDEWNEVSPEETEGHLSEGDNLEGIKKVPEKPVPRYAAVPDAQEDYHKEIAESGWDGLDKQYRENVLASGGYPLKYADVKAKDLPPSFLQVILNYNQGRNVESKAKGLPEGVLWPVKLNVSYAHLWPQPRWTETTAWVNGAHLLDFEQQDLTAIAQDSDPNYLDDRNNKMALSRATKLFSRATMFVQERVPLQVCKKIGVKFQATEAFKKEKKDISEKVYAELKKQFQDIKAVFSKLAKPKNADWNDVAKLANLNVDLGDRLIKNYSKKREYPTTVPEGMTQHTAACKILFTELDDKLRQLLHLSDMDGLFRWNNYLTDVIHYYNKLWKNESFRSIM